MSAFELHGVPPENLTAPAYQQVAPAARAFLPRRTHHSCANRILEWLEAGGKIVGFSAADPRNGNIFALFVEEDYEGRGIGQALLERACGVLVEARSPRMWLTTWPGTRAEQFYRCAGWRVVGTDDGNLVFERQGHNQPAVTLISEG